MSCKFQNSEAESPKYLLPKTPVDFASFKFPEAELPLMDPPYLGKRFRKSAMNSSKSSVSGIQRPRIRRAVSVYWDLESCPVPLGKSPSSIVNFIRNFFHQDHLQIEFQVVCDVYKESEHVTRDFNSTNVNVIHVNTLDKESTYLKLRQHMRRFCESFPRNARMDIILITGDSNFSKDISEIRDTTEVNVILLYPEYSKSFNLISKAKKAISFEGLIEHVPEIGDTTTFESDNFDALINNLPSDSGLKVKVEEILKKLDGTMVTYCPPLGIVRFKAEAMVNRAIDELNGYILGGNVLQIQLLHQKKPNEVASGSGDQLAQLKTPKKETVLLTISNIDATLGVVGIQKLIKGLVQPFSKTSTINIRQHNRFTYICKIEVQSCDNAINILQTLHRFKIGCKRILVTLAPKGRNLQAVRNKVQNIFKTTGNWVPMKTLLQAYEQKFGETLDYDTLIGLSKYLETSQSQRGNLVSIRRDLPLYCFEHRRRNRIIGPSKIIKIKIGLREFSAKLHILLFKHDGLLFLDGLEECYSKVFGDEGTPLAQNDGVYLEHIISYVPGVQIKEDLNIKTVVWSPPYNDGNNCSDSDSEGSGSCRSKSSTLVGFTRQIVDLFKEYEGSCIPLSDVSDCYLKKYKTPLIVNDIRDRDRILSMIPHVVQMFGPNDIPLLTLTHRAQVKRFIQEITRLIKSSEDRRISTLQLAEIYNKEFKRNWKLTDYGVNDLSDLLDDIPQGSIYITEGKIANESILSLPIKNLTETERQKLKRFKMEVTQMLSKIPFFTINFADFVPMYHRRFNRQCKLADYGFTKLLDLFESIPDVIKVFDGQAERMIKLDDFHALRYIIAPNIYLQLSCNRKDLSNHKICVPNSNGEIQEWVPFKKVFNHFGGDKWRFYSLEFNCSNMKKLILGIYHICRNEEGSLYVRPKINKPLKRLSSNLLELFYDISSADILFKQLHNFYYSRYGDLILPYEYGFSDIESLLLEVLEDRAQLAYGGNDLKILFSNDVIITSSIRKAILMAPLRCIPFTDLQHQFQCYSFEFNSSTMELLLGNLPPIFELKKQNGHQFCYLKDLPDCQRHPLPLYENLTFRKAMQKAMKIKKRREERIDMLFSSEPNSDPIQFQQLDANAVSSASEEDDEESLAGPSLYSRSAESGVTSRSMPKVSPNLQYQYFPAN